MSKVGGLHIQNHNPIIMYLSSKLVFFLEGFLVCDSIIQNLPRGQGSKNNHWAKYPFYIPSPHQINALTSWTGHEMKSTLWVATTWHRLDVLVVVVKGRRYMCLLMVFLRHTLYLPSLSSPFHPAQLKCTGGWHIGVCMQHVHVMQRNLSLPLWPFKTNVWSFTN